MLNTQTFTSLTATADGERDVYLRFQVTEEEKEEEERFIERK